MGDRRPEGRLTSILRRRHTAEDAKDVHITTEIHRAAVCPTLPLLQAIERGETFPRGDSRL